MNLELLSFEGMEIIRSPLLPYQKMKISSEVPMTDKFRSEMDQWLLEFFGMVDCLVMADPASKNAQPALIMSEALYRKLRAEHQQKYMLQVENEVINGRGNNEPTGLVAGHVVGP